ncbi:hypothetical protein M0813_09018 [Anaeramoeba flamelloides]|uniref:Uncharacterized protein n=1 Tax=Anaeramoeba flamelloides TaxID=1746091 RepID=A0ABQ8X6A1_9EUKA|nr:hypothetical protein M0813_09018 [Anaeramoeba flamelloides]
MQKQQKTKNFYKQQVKILKAAHKKQTGILETSYILALQTKDLIKNLEDMLHQTQQDRKKLKKRKCKKKHKKKQPEEKEKKIQQGTDKKLENRKSKVLEIGEDRKRKPKPIEHTNNFINHTQLL